MLNFEMKEIILTLLLTTMINNNVLAQYGIKELPLNINFRLVKLNYENKSDEKAFTNFEYNDEGFLIKAIWKLTDNSRKGIISYKYDNKGNIIEKYRIFSDSTSIIQTFEYDQYSNLLIDNFERSDGTKGRVEYIYDNNKKLLQADCNKQNGWFSGIINYQYNEKDKIFLGNLLQNNIIIGKITYSYDQQGLLIKEYWNFPERWNQTFTYEYKELNR